MQNLSPRHVKTEESLRLGVVSGWYSTKVSGTFVSGPHRFGGRLPAQDRRDRSSAASQEEMTSRELAEASLQEQGDRSYGTRAGQCRWLRV